MQKIKSGVTFFRKQLKIKGKSQHLGRGFYRMEFDCSLGELTEKVEQLIAKHADMLVVTRNENHVTVAIKHELCEDKYYNTLVFGGGRFFPLTVVV